jgi:hypothetical protein
VSIIVFLKSKKKKQKSLIDEAESIQDDFAKDKWIGTVVTGIRCSLAVVMVVATLYSTYNYHEVSLKAL